MTFDRYQRDFMYFYSEIYSITETELISYVKPFGKI